MLLENDEQQNIPDSNTIFQGPKNTRSQGKITPKTGYNTYGKDANRFVMSQYERDIRGSREIIVTTIREPETASEELPKTTEGTAAEAKKKRDAITIVEQGAVEQKARRMPFSYDDQEDMKIGFSLEDGRLTLGTRWAAHAEYFIALVGSIRESWDASIPIAHYYGIIKDDAVEVMLSIDASGKIEYVKLLQPSAQFQESMTHSCVNAVRYARPIPPPPEDLIRENGIGGKLMVPFRFIYQNIKNKY